MALMACLLLPALCRADGSDARPMRYKMDYVSGAYLRKSGSTLHFVTADLEWPAWINAGRPQTLMNHLAAKLFGNTDFAVADGFDRYLDSLGEPLEAVPDDDAGLNKVYHSLELKLVEYSTARYISFRIMAAERNAESHQVRSMVHHIFTYDIVNDRILGKTDLLRKICFEGNVAYYDFMNLVRQQTPSEYWEDERFYSMGFPQEFCLMNDGLVCDLGFTSYDSPANLLVFIPYKEAYDYYTKALKKLLQAEARLNPVGPVSTQESAGEAVDTTKVYNVAEENPVFQGGQDEMIKFMTDNLRFPPIEEMLEIKGRVVAQFVVERDGTVSTVSVVGPASPGFDREVVRVVKMMPRWTPGKIGGQSVRTRMSLPITWKPQ